MQNKKPGIETIQFKGETYPAFQADGFAANFAFAYAEKICKGFGYDIGCNRLEWAFPGATPIDPILDSENDAYNLKMGPVDYIFSSHCLEHLPDWVKALDYWNSKLKDNGVLFLYLPDHSQKYWRPHHNRKHLHAFTPEIIKAYFYDNLHMWRNVFVSGVDLNNSFMVMAEKGDNFKFYNAALAEGGRGVSAE
jgi:SAM-dependent methyltransferase